MVFHDIKSVKGLKVGFLTSTFGHHQIINELTHVIKTSSPCIDFIFTSQANLVIESGVHSWLHAIFHHQITCAKFNLNVFCCLLYEREAWHYAKWADSICIQQVIESFDRENACSNLNVNKRVLLFSETILNMFHSFIPPEIINCDDRDLPWITKSAKLKMLNNSLPTKSNRVSDVTHSKIS